MELEKAKLYISQGERKKAIKLEIYEMKNMLSEVMQKILNTARAAEKV